MRRGVLMALMVGVAASAFGAAAKRVDTGRSGEYVSGQWKYVYTIRAKGSRSEGRGGVLLLGGRVVEAAAKAAEYDRIRTPWGLMQFFGPKHGLFGSSGWLTKRVDDRPLDLKKGRLLRTPKVKPLPPPKPLELTLGHSAKVQRVAVGQKIHIRLEGNVTTGYSWAVLRTDGEAIRQEGKVVYKAAAAKPMVVGSGGVFHATFEAVKPGRSHVWLGYRRPWEKGKEPIKKFEGIFDVVQPWQIGQDAQGVMGKVLTLRGDGKPVLGPLKPRLAPGPGGGPPLKFGPLSVPVHIFRGPLKPFAKPNARHAALVKTVRSDKQGNYRVALPPGVYTVVAEIKGKLYLNAQRGDGHWATVTVHPGGWSTWNIHHTL